MQNKYNLTEIIDVRISFMGEERYNLGIKFDSVDEEDNGYIQKNFIAESKSGAISYFEDIIKSFGFNEHIFENSFREDKQTNEFVLIDRKLELIKKKAGFKSILENEANGDVNNIVPTNIDKVHKIKGKDVFYKFDEDTWKRMYVINRKGSIIEGDSTDRFDAILTFKDKDIIKYFLKRKEDLTFDLIEFEEGKTSFELDKKFKIDEHGNKLQ